MANEVLYSGLSDLALAEVGAKELALAVQDRSVLGGHPAMFYGGDLMGSKSTTVQVPVVGAFGYDLMGDGSENSAASNTAFTDSSASIAVARKVVTRAVSGLVLNTGSDHGIFSDAAMLAQEALISREIKLRDMVANLVDGFSDSVGSSSVDLTIDVILEARKTLEANGVQGPYMCILHPQQWYDLQIDMKSETGLLSGEAARLLIETQQGLGWKGRHFGIDFFVTTSVPTANAGADRAGGMFGQGCIGWVDSSIKDLPFGNENRLNLGKASVTITTDGTSDMHQITTTCYLGAAIVQDKGVTIVSDNA